MSGHVAQPLWIAFRPNEVARQTVELIDERHLTDSTYGKDWVSVSAPDDSSAAHEADSYFERLKQRGRRLKPGEVLVA